MKNAILHFQIIAASMIAEADGISNRRAILILERIVKKIKEEVNNAEYPVHDTSDVYLAIREAIAEETSVPVDFVASPCIKLAMIEDFIARMNKPI